MSLKTNRPLNEGEDEAEVWENPVGTAQFKGGKQFFLPLVFPVLSKDGREERQ